MTQPLSIVKGGNLPLSWPFKSRQFNITINTVWDKIFKSGLSKVCGRQLLKIWGDMDCLLQNLLSLLFNTLSHLRDLKMVYVS